VTHDSCRILERLQKVGRDVRRRAEQLQETTVAAISQMDRCALILSAGGAAFASSSIGSIAKLTKVADLIGLIEREAHERRADRRAAAASSRHLNHFAPSRLDERAELHLSQIVPGAGRRCGQMLARCAILIEERRLQVRHAHRRERRAAGVLRESHGATLHFNSLWR